MPRPDDGTSVVATAPDGSLLDEALHPLELAEVLQPYLDIDSTCLGEIDRGSMRRFADANGLEELEDDALDELLRRRVSAREVELQESEGTLDGSNKSKMKTGPRVSLLRFLRSEGADLGFGEPWQVSVIFNGFADGVLEENHSEGTTSARGEGAGVARTRQAAGPGLGLGLPPGSPDSAGRVRLDDAESSHELKPESRLRSTSTSSTDPGERMRRRARAELRTQLQGSKSEASADVAMSLSTFGRLLGGLHVFPETSP